MSEPQGILELLQNIYETLKRIEDRQIKTTKMVEEVKEHEPEVGGFGKMEG